MPFGKYKGERVADLPLGYLAWILDEATHVDAELRTALRDELAARLGLVSQALPAPAPDVRDAAAALIAAGYRSAAKRVHPDAGGSHALMVTLGAARAFLERAAGVTA